VKYIIMNLTKTASHTLQSHTFALHSSWWDLHHRLAWLVCIKTVETIILLRLFIRQQRYS